MTSESAERAWVSEMKAHVRFAAMHKASAAIHAWRGDVVLSGLEAGRAVAERAAFDAAVVLHPEWVAPTRPADWARRRVG